MELYAKISIRFEQIPSWVSSEVLYLLYAWWVSPSGDYTVQRNKHPQTSVSGTTVSVRSVEESAH